ncbi:DUF3302 domain-containing protein [Rodentibacter caecimuris]|nr:DUF3302 domain-containing protein [Rodentibacter heylii]QIA78129.1 DUF3302 domain-containing protein [Rodentibacter heylii]TGY50934.1 DUF3302 domain-containing protein [Pasteurella caecimuris]
MLDYLALFFLLFASIAIFYAVIAIHDIPYEIAKKRNHPHLEAIHYAGWVSLFTLHVIWPFLWIWATLWHKENGWGNGNRQKESELLLGIENVTKQLPELEKQNLKLETELATLRQELNVLTKKLAQLENKQNKSEV